MTSEKYLSIALEEEVEREEFHKKNPWIERELYGPRPDKNKQPFP